MKQSDKYLPTAFNNTLTILERLNALIKWVAEHQGEVDGLQKQINTLDETKESKVELSNRRKLSTTGNFTGSIHGKDTRIILSNITDNEQRLNYLLSQFSDGWTGLIVDGGFFENGEVLKTYDGGIFND